MQSPTSTVNLKSYLIICFVVLFLTVSSFGYVLVKNFHYVDQRTAQINQTMAAVADIQELKASYKSAESSVRFAFLRETEDYLDDYYKGWDYPVLIEDIRKDIEADSNDPNTLKLLDELGAIMEKRFLRFDEVINIWRQGGRAALDSLRAQNLNIGFNLSVKTDAILKTLLDDETDKQHHREAAFHDSERLTTQLLSALVTILIVVFGFMAFIIWRLVAHEERQKYLTRYANDLEGQVASRTQELVEANKEMETFSYSVSHDLRAPLRAIEGFSNILIEDFAGALGEDGMKRLRVIISNVRNMGQLIDDILNFSRMGRKEVSKMNTSLNKIVDNAMDEVRKSPYFKGEKTVHVQDLGFANVDGAIFRQVFTNLIGNAVKFSSTKSNPDITVGAMGTSPQTYYVRDNGVGFDMKHVNKLFNVFNRLHKPDDFEGTGVGLAIVKKIITKHGGRVWAESSPDSGATFYFSLP